MQETVATSMQGCKRNVQINCGEWRPETIVCAGVSGGRTRIRTLDPLIKSQLLYQLSYAPDAPCGEAPQVRVL
jgi:hypothetical protein